jgi:hypothetical protein
MILRLQSLLTGVTYLLDTNAISDLMRAAARIETWIAGLDQGDRVVCQVPLGKRRSRSVRLVSRDNDLSGIGNLSVVALG